MLTRSRLTGVTFAATSRMGSSPDGGPVCVIDNVLERASWLREAPAGGVVGGVVVASEGG